ncbi:hypothetical protein T190115A13A_30213 [Tenacibaculum sp. 190524A02b]|uniref:Uncharacterized protein n=1 Tax=Tenacibaculum vairaonense TaxID=3137860 RepID=A0ABM9PNQ4_9FLAO
MKKTNLKNDKTNQSTPIINVTKFAEQLNAIIQEKKRILYLVLHNWLSYYK